MKTAKRLMAPHRGLTVDEMNTIQEQTSKEWLQLTDDEVQEWQDIHSASKLQRSVDARAPILGRAADNEDEPMSIQNLWGHREGPGHLVPATSIIEAFEKLSPSARRDLAIHDPALVISEKDAKQRLKSDQPEGRAKICSCWEAKKNVCRVPLDAIVQERMETITAQLNAYIDTLPRGTECNHIIHLRGSDGDGVAVETTIDVMVWLVLRRLKPVVQIFARLALQESGSLEFVSPAFPFIVQIPARGARTDPRHNVANLCTSDEFALSLAQSRGTWVIRPVLWEEVNTARSLCEARVIGFGDPHIPTSHVSCRHIQSVSLCDLLDEMAQETKRFGRLSSTESRPTAPPPIDDELVDPIDALDADMMEGMPNDFVDDATTELQESMGVVAPIDDAGIVLDDPSACIVDPSTSIVDSKKKDAPCEGDSDLDIEAVQALLVAEGVDATSGKEVEPPSSGGGASGSHSGLPSPDLVASAVISDTGHVSCPLKPWCEFTNIGRITTWPDHLPMDKRNVSIKCHMHPNCSSPVRTRRHFTNEALLTWLLTGACESIVSDGRSKELAKEHKAKWAYTIDTFRALSKGPPVP